MIGLDGLNFSEDMARLSQGVKQSVGGRVKNTLSTRIYKARLLSFEFVCGSTCRGLQEIRRAAAGGSAS